MTSIRAKRQQGQSAEGPGARFPAQRYLARGTGDTLPFGTVTRVANFCALPILRAVVPGLVQHHGRVINL